MTQFPSQRPEQRWWLTAFIAGPQVRLSLLIFLGVALLPPETGLGVELCTVKRCTGAPCPGCGMTRSGANLLRGHVGRAFDYHPFGLIMHPILLGLVVLSVLPGAARRAFARRLLPWRRLIATLSVLFWIAFLFFGFARWVAVMNGLLTFPGDWV